MLQFLAFLICFICCNSAPTVPIYSIAGDYALDPTVGSAIIKGVSDENHYNVIRFYEIDLFNKNDKVQLIDGIGAYDVILTSVPNKPNIVYQQITINYISSTNSSGFNMNYKVRWRYDIVSKKCQNFEMINAINITT